MRHLSYLNGWHPFELIRFDPVKMTMWRCLVLQIWEEQKQLLRKQRGSQIIKIQITSCVHVTIMPMIQFADLQVQTTLLSDKGR